ncbi:sugar transferase [Thermosynechococcaceae cyanobacterium BACA0444]|uniref:Sugar transferase n=1 Tax=Pseudocalidococcus azoricus BACA0444 TaxID=2918990 RepID=A0AAE4FN83_9CYAN|nr:sugar transferase [Pseudocalidococcus azoricus]MDS3859219.1 sugar transferase [Pseudocalidococcus azoricus BACA0444]
MAQLVQDLELLDKMLVSPESDIVHLGSGAWMKVPRHLVGAAAIDFSKLCHPFLSQEFLLETTMTNLTLDFSHTEAISGKGLAVLLEIQKLASSLNFVITGWNANPGLRSLLENIGLQCEWYSDISSVNNTQSIQPHPSVNSWGKRVIDILGAIVGLLIMAVLFIPIAIAIKLDSPGPIFFSQIRCGLLGERFRIWKFRSMIVNAEDLKDMIVNQAKGAWFKNDHDPRVTRVGSFLRKYSLDEIPQFWNVLCGEMSLIGTRPPTLDEIKFYDILKWKRLDVKPGLSGEWQVNGRSKIRSLDDVIQLDLDYQEKWSLMYDIKLILKTIFVVFNKDSGAV